jgi:F-type H+-transporting ATPase subunit b
MFDINATLPIFLLMFFAFMAALNSWVLKPIGEVIEKRQQKIKSDIEAGSVARQQADGILTDYQSRLHQVRGEAQAIVTDAQAKANSERQAQLKVVQEKGQVKVQQEKAVIEGERKSLVEQLVDEEKVLVATIAKKLLGDTAAVNLDPATIKRAIEEAS